ncbi:MAG: hypothetical protein J6Y65_02985 [Eggerthellaceae bacterium]|nr:hypothetical protein [Eggerthellaceae bacterium]
MAARPAYMYDSLAYAMPNEAPVRREYERPEARPRPIDNPEVIRGNAPLTSTSVLPESLLFLTVVSVVGLILLALAAFAFVGLRSATIQTEVNNNAVSSQLSLARSEGYQLELAESSLTNLNRIRTSAAALGMVAAPSIELIEVPADAVVIDENGTLRLTDTILKNALISAEAAL